MPVNRIQGLLDKSDYGYWDYINYHIDGYWLDEKLEELYPGNMYQGLIPTLVYWMERNDEKIVVWKRILPEEGETAICPVLMCPDDNDFSCTLIVAEICNCDGVVQWKRIGLDKTEQWDAEKVGIIVDWFDRVPALNFDKKEYLVMVASFKDRMELDMKMMDA